MLRKGFAELLCDFVWNQCQTVNMVCPLARSKWCIFSIVMGHDTILFKFWLKYNQLLGVWDGCWGGKASADQRFVRIRTQSFEAEIVNCWKLNGKCGLRKQRCWVPWKSDIQVKSML